MRRQEIRAELIAATAHNRDVQCPQWPGDDVTAAERCGAKDYREIPSEAWPRLVGRSGQTWALGYRRLRASA